MEVVVNGTMREVGEGHSIAMLLEELSISPRGAAVEVNFELVPRARHGEQMLHQGDHVEIVTLVGGG